MKITNEVVVEKTYTLVMTQKELNTITRMLGQLSASSYEKLLHSSNPDKFSTIKETESAWTTLYAKANY